MEKPTDLRENGTPPTVLSNAEIADRLAGLAQMLSTQKENPYKVKAYHRAAARIRNLPDSLDEMVRHEEDLTRFSGIGAGIASAIREIVKTGTLAKLEKLRGEAPPAVAELSGHPRLDPKRVMRVHKKLNISSLAELREEPREWRNREDLWKPHGAAPPAGPDRDARHAAISGGRSA